MSETFEAPETADDATAKSPVQTARRAENKKTHAEKSEHHQSYIKLNIQSLQDEFSDLDSDIVQDVYFSSDKDCERARRNLRNIAGRDEAQETTSASAGNTTTKQDLLLWLDELQGDLFSCNDNASMCHCVSQDMAMGKGIAVLFKNRFGNVRELKAQHAKIGEAAVLCKPNQEHAFVYYLVTKQRYFHKPHLEAVQQSCAWMRDHAQTNGVTTIAMPRIGCGLDGLQWLDVKDMLIHLFSDTGIRIQVYTL